MRHRLTPAEAHRFRRAVLAYVHPQQQDTVAPYFDRLRLTDARIGELIAATAHPATTAIIPVAIEQWHAEDVAGAVTPDQLAADWLTAKRTQPRRWKVVATLRYPRAWQVIDDPTELGQLLHHNWEQASIRRPDVVRAWMHTQLARLRIQQMPR